MRRLALAGLLAFSTGAVAEEQNPIPACNPAEPPVVCMLKVQRNAVMDELAMEAAGRRADTAAADAKATALADYWKQYVSGLEKRVAQEKVHVK